MEVMILYCLPLPFKLVNTYEATNFVAFFLYMNVLDYTSQMFFHGYYYDIANVNSKLIFNTADKLKIVSSTNIYRSIMNINISYLG